MELKTCHHCQKPFLADQKSCPRCGTDYEYNADSWANVTCMMLMVLFIFGLIFMPILMLAAMLFKW